MTGLKICTRCRAISARRSRRINSSLLPENIGPTITSIQPMLPLTMSTAAPASYSYANTFGCENSASHHRAARTNQTVPMSFVAIDGGIEERSEGVDHGDAEGVLAGDEVAC